MANLPPTTTGKPAESAQSKGLIRVTILTYRNPKLSEDEFHTHWSKIHSAKASFHLAKFGVISYRQYHTPSSLRNSLISQLPSLGKTESSVADYDGFVELIMPELACYEAALSDKDGYYRDVIAVDEAGFADMVRSKVTVGWVQGYVEGGEVVEVEHREGYINA
ncbi:hypothetical protein OHC33_005016 [Knufia fluminis]|uniref:EthD domain-containing protein n=1 Tax=Knufia fluminis TaxID=191047 RepID=A0AAN8I480_9EURO|nr:hypothetical protein OHC33_005016 [Knufia fluminis]